MQALHCPPNIMTVNMNVPFSFQAVIDGYWEFFHDDDCDAVLDPDTKICSACGWRPDLQSMGARRIDKKQDSRQSTSCSV